MSADGLLRMFGEEGLKKISTDPLLIPYLSDPLFLEMVDDISLHPENILKWQSNPKLQNALMIILPMMMSSVPPKFGPTGPAPPTLATAEEEKEQGNAYFREGHYEQALAHYNQAIQLDPKNIVYYSNKASALNKLKRFEDAMEAALLGIEKGQTHNATNEQIAKAYVKLAVAAMGTGRDRGAYTALQESLNYNKDEAVQRMFDDLKKKLDAQERRG